MAGDHVVERLREHRRGEKGHGPEGFRADIDEIVTQRRREHKDAARAYGMLAAILSSSSPEPAIMYCVSSVASVCQPRCPPGSIS